MAEATVMSVNRTALLAMFEQIGFGSANTWGEKRMHKKIHEALPELVDKETADKVTDADSKALLKSILKHIKGGGTVEVVDEEEAPADEATETAGDDKTAEDTTEATEGDDTGDSATTDAEDDKPKAETGKGKGKGGKKGGKKPKAEKKPKPKKEPDPNKTAGVKYGDAVTYDAGAIIRQFGLTNGVTQEMVDALAEKIGRTNDHQDWFNLRNAWHAIRGYLNINSADEAKAHEAELSE